jgi:hypothetical protein
MIHAISENSVPKRRWFIPTPGKLLAVLMAIEGILFLADWFHWLPKGWAILITVAAVGMFLIGMLLWFICSLLHPTLRNSFVAILSLEGILLLFEWRGAFPVGWTAMIHLTSVGLFFLFVILCFIVNRIIPWRFQFSIRSLLMLMIVVAIMCSWLAAEMKAANEQKKAVEAIRLLGGKAIYDFRFDQSGYLIYVDSDPFDARKEPDPPYPKCLLSIFGDDFFMAVYYVEISMPTQEVTDDSLIHVQKFVGLRKLLLQETSVTDAGLSHLQHLPLNDLVFRGEHITDDGLKRLEVVPII